MKQITIMLQSINAVKNFVNIVNRYDFEADIAVGKYVVDAKSIMGIFSLDLSKPLNLTIHTENTEKFIGEIAEFIVK